MTKYHCWACNFETKNKTDYKRHCSTTKHRKRWKNFEEAPPINHTQPTHKSHKVKHKKKFVSVEKSVSVCPFCGDEFSRKDSLKRHKVSCSQKKLQEKEEIIKSNQRTMRKLNRDHKKTVTKYEDELHYFKQILQLSEESGSKNVSAYNYISQNYQAAQPLTAITFERFVRNNKIQYAQSDKSYNEKLIEDIIYSHKHGILDKYLGSTIVEMYMTKNPDEQSIWSTDQARLKYVIRQCIGDEMVRWVADSKGVNTAKMLIDPLSSKIKKILNTYNTKYYIPKESESYSLNEQKDMMEGHLAIMEICRDIDNKKIHRNLLKYMAPFFSTEKLHISNSKKDTELDILDKYT